MTGKTPLLSGPNNPNWKGGVRHRHGYIYKKTPNHPYTQSDNYIAVHRLIYENYLSIILDEEVYIPKSYDVHHINEIKDDNRLINFDLLPTKIHRQIHMKKDMSDRYCLLCNSTTTQYDKRGWFLWSKYKNGFICHVCNARKRRQKKELN